MNWKRTATLSVVGGTLVTLLARASTSVVAPPQPSSPPARAGVEPKLLVADIDRLRERLNAPIDPATPSRNPFAFRAAPLEPVVARPRVDDRAAVTRLLVAPPPITLVGLAEEAGPDGPVRTAILSSVGELHFVHAGDLVVAGYRVTAVHEDGVELRGPADAPPVFLRLK